jgi:hypothetical protein
MAADFKMKSKPVFFSKLEVFFFLNTSTDREINLSKIQNGGFIQYVGDLGN